MQIRLTNNGTVMQNFNTDDMAHKIPRCIEWVTSIHTLLPGDILATGTNHRGLNPFMDGDKIELTCEGLGTLHIKIKDQHKRTWARITRLKHKESGARACTHRKLAGVRADEVTRRDNLLATVARESGHPVIDMSQSGTTRTSWNFSRISATGRTRRSCVCLLMPVSAQKGASD